jgi:hypothetical protein
MGPPAAAALTAVGRMPGVCVALGLWDAVGETVAVPAESEQVGPRGSGCSRHFCGHQRCCLHACRMAAVSLRCGAASGGAVVAWPALARVHAGGMSALHGHCSRG